MASLAESDTELLTEHFGYPPVSLLDDIINSVNILAERALNSVEQALLRQPAASLGFKPARKKGDKKKGGGGGGEAEAADAAEAAEAARRLEVENGTHQLETLLCASIDRNFDKFELYVMRNILCVRPEDRNWMRLAHYEGLDWGKAGEAADGGATEGADDDDDDDDEAIAHLHRRLQASQRLGHLLDVETMRNEALLAQLRAVAAPSAAAAAPVTADPAGTDAPAAPASLAFLLDRGVLTDSDAHAPLTTTTAFALAQLPALRRLSGALRQMVPDLAAGTAGTAGTEEGADDDAAAAAGTGTGPGQRAASWRRERLEYIEQATRKHLERVRGLDLDQQGELLGRDEGGAPGPGPAASSAAASSTAPNVEPAALTAILGLLREHHGAPGTSGDGGGDDDETMDET